MSRGLQSTAEALVITFLMALAGVFVVLLFQDYLVVALSSWISGEPKMMVKLEIYVPRVDAEYCAVVVIGFGSPSHSDVVYAGEVSPGRMVVARELRPAVVAKWSYDPETGERRVEYYEPVEYLVVVNCPREDGTAYQYGRIHQVFPRALVWTHWVEVSFSESEH